MSAGSAHPQDNPSADTMYHPAVAPHESGVVHAPTAGQSVGANPNWHPAPGLPSPTSEPVNPFYALLLISSVAFVITGLVLALVPWPELPLWLQRHGWKVLLVEMALVIVTGLASMVLDRWRSWNKRRSAP